MLPAAASVNVAFPVPATNRFPVPSALKVSGPAPPTNVLQSRMHSRCAAKEGDRQGRRGACACSTGRTKSNGAERRSRGGVADLIGADAGERSDRAVADAGREIHPV